MYTTFPWPALCAEVAKLQVELRSEAVLDGENGAFAITSATSALEARNRWLKSVTPPGIENSRDITKQREESQSPTEKPKAQIASRSLTKRSGSMAAKLAVMAANALRNYDVDRALELLEQIRVTCDPDASPDRQPLKIIS